MKKCELENCTYCKMNHISGMYICIETGEETFEDTECELEE